MRVHYDGSKFPLIVTEWPDGQVEDESLDAWMRRCEDDWQKGRQIALHIGMHPTTMTAVQRKRVSEFTKINTERLAEVVVAAAIVSESAAVRGLITAINWFAAPPFPQRIFARRNEAEGWLGDRLAEDVRRRRGS
jgi:hypothetical protein